MTERERLIELVCKAFSDKQNVLVGGAIRGGKSFYLASHLADYLLANGVTIPVRCGECKNYDVETAWCKIHSCFINSNGDFCHPWESNEWKMFDGAYYCADGGREDNGT